MRRDRRLDEVVANQPGIAGLGHDASGSRATGAKVQRRDRRRRKVTGPGLNPVDAIFAPQADEGDFAASAGALLDRITHHVHILEMNGESYRLKQSRSRRRPPSE